jgi:hypothetical protein
MDSSGQSEVFASIVEKLLDQKVDALLSRLQGLLQDTLNEVLSLRESQRKLELRVSYIENLLRDAEKPISERVGPRG